MNEFAALADPTRREIVEMLMGGEMAAGDIARKFDVTPSAISQHLRQLRDADLIRMRVDRQRRMYSLEPSGFRELEKWLQRMRGFWSRRLDALERELSRPETPAKQKKRRKK